LVAQTLPGADPVHKVTIIPRGRALGLTQQLPTEDKYNYSRDYLLNRITILLGGRAAEEMVLHQQTTGAGDDLEKATEMARKMVCEWGMSEKLGPLTFGKHEEHIFLGREFARQQDYSEETAVMIDAEVKRIILDCASRARTVLEEQIAKLHGLAKALLEHESLDGDAIAKVLKASSAGTLEGAPAQFPRGAGESDGEAPAPRARVRLGSRPAARPGDGHRQRHARFLRGRRALPRPRR